MGFEITILSLFSFPYKSPRKKSAHWPVKWLHLRRNKTIHVSLQGLTFPFNLKFACDFQIEEEDREEAWQAEDEAELRWSFGGGLFSKQDKVWST